MYSSAVLIAVALISGYLYIMQTEAERYKFKRSAGWHCYFHVAAWGVIFIGLAWLLAAIVGFFGLPAFLREIKVFLAAHSPTRTRNILPNDEMNFLAFCAIALVLPFIWCKVIRPLFYKTLDRLYHKNYSPLTIKQLREKRSETALLAVVKDNPFEEILTFAWIYRQNVIFSLSSRKFYVGRVTKMPAFSNGKMEYLKFVPFFSGYRDKDALETVNTTNYLAIFADGKGLMSNEKIIPCENIEDISFFDLDIYGQFQRQNSSAPATQ